MLQLLEKKTMRQFLDRKRRLDDAEREDREASAEESYEKEFTKLREMSASYKAGNVYPTSEGEKPCNAPKNRYKDILPFDQTRVKLKNLKDSSANDYINASYIKGAVEGQTYIASQAPNDKTVKEFWQMIWENNVSVILMACREYEGEPPKLKCQRYWPNSTAEEMSYGSIEVTLVKEETTEYKEHFIRHMIAKSGNESRALVHLHYQEWPDKGVPRSTAAILDLIDRLRSNLLLNKEKSPLALVHCSAGCGRTGTIMVIDYILSLLKYGKLTGDFSIFEIVAEMRRQRMAIVQSQEQYVFVHEAVAELFEQKLKTIDSNGFGNTEQSGATLSKPKILDVNVDYEILDQSAGTTRRKPVLPSSKPVLANFPGAVKSPDGPSTVDSCSSMLPSLPPPSEPQYAIPFAVSNAKKKPHLPVVRTSSPPVYGVVRKDPSNDTNSKNEYSYANPYQTDKWSLQAIALGLKQESAYATVDDLGCRDNFGVTSDYSEINSDFHSRPIDHRRTLEHPSKGYLDEISGPPPSKRIMNNIFSKLTITNFGKQDPSPGVTSPCEIAQVIFRDVNISFPNRIAKPHGKRPMPVRTEQTSAVY